MANIVLRNKVLTLDDELYDTMVHKHYFEFDEQDCISLIEPVLTTGDTLATLQYPNMDQVIATTNATRLSELLTHGVQLFLEVTA